MAKNLPAIAGDAGDGGSILDQGDPLEKGLASHCLGNPWTEEPGGAIVHRVTDMTEHAHTYLGFGSSRFRRPIPFMPTSSI